MGAKRMTKPNGYRRVGRWAAYGTAGTAVAVALLMAVSPLAGALKPHTILPPYKHSAAVQSKGVSYSGNCKSASSVSGNHWIPKTGNVTTILYSLAKGCAVTPTGNGYAYASASDYWQIGIPVKVYTNTGHNFSVDWSYVLTITTAANGGGCPAAKNVPGTYTYSYCYAYVYASTYMSMELYDQTNNSYLYGQHGSFSGPVNYTDIYNDSYCNGSGTCSNYSGNYTCISSIYTHCVPSGSMASGTNNTWINSASNCGYGYNGYCYYWHNWTLNSSHKYWVLAFIDVFSYADLGGYGPGHQALASLNAATLGNTGWKIVSVTVT